MPAALNGIVGVKPTRGLLSTVGVVPACRSLDCVSVFAGSVTDATSVAGLAAGPAGAVGPGRPDARRWSWTPGRSASACPTSPSWTSRGTSRCATPSWRRSNGPATRSARWFPVGLAPFLEAGRLLYEGALVAERLADLAAFLAARPQSVLPVTRQVIESGAGYDAPELFRHQHRLHDLRARVRGRVPSDRCAAPADRADDVHDRARCSRSRSRHNLTLGRFTQFVNLLDLAAVAVPAGFTIDGRPAGVSVIGPAFSDDSLALLAARLVAALEPRATARPAVRRVTRGPAGRATTAATEPEGDVVLAVVGLHLMGEKRHHELVERGARFERAARTAPEYRLYQLATGAPGLVRTRAGGAAIEVELWRLPGEVLGGLLAGIGAPLSLGRLRLADGTEHMGFLCEAYAVDDALDITAYGGWRAYRGRVERRGEGGGMTSIGPVRADPYPWPYDGTVDISRVALVCIDWQTDFCGPGGYVDAMGYDIGLTRAGLPNTAKLLAHARSLGMTVIHTREGHDADLSDLPANKRWRSARIGAEIGSAGPCGRILIKGEPGWDIVPEVAPAPGEVVIDKPGKGAFYATNLDLVLRTRGITHLDPDRHHDRRVRAHDDARGQRPRVRVRRPLRLHRRHRRRQPRGGPAHGDDAGRRVRLCVHIGGNHRRHHGGQA